MITSVKSKLNMEKTDTLLFKINVKNNNFYLNALTNQPEEKEKEKINISLLLSDMAWFIVKRFKNKKLEDVNKIKNIILFYYLLNSINLFYLIYIILYIFVN